MTSEQKLSSSCILFILIPLMIYIQQETMGDQGNMKVAKITCKSAKMKIFVWSHVDFHCLCCMQRTKYSKQRLSSYQQLNCNLYGWLGYVHMVFLLMLQHSRFLRILLEILDGFKMHTKKKGIMGPVDFFSARTIKVSLSDFPDSFSQAKKTTLWL